MEKVVVVVWVTLAAACSSGSGPADSLDPASVVGSEATSVVGVGPTPSETAALGRPALGLDDEAKAAVALAAFEAAPEPVELIAWDLLDVDVAGDQVTLTLCGWDGETVFDQVQLVRYLLTGDSSGEAATELLFSNVGAGECLNTELINSALAATRVYDRFWGAVLEDPTTWDTDEAAKLLAAEPIMQSSELVGQWVLDGVVWRDHGFDGQLPNSSLKPVLVRQGSAGEEDLLEFIACRDLAPGYGLYKSDVLVDDFKADGYVGNHVIDRYQLQRVGRAWLIRGLFGNVWSDCDQLEPTWEAAINAWLPDPVRWERADG